MMLFSNKLELFYKLKVILAERILGHSPCTIICIRLITLNYFRKTTKRKLTLTETNHGLISFIHPEHCSNQGRKLSRRIFPWIRTRDRNKAFKHLSRLLYHYTTTLFSSVIQNFKF